ncbi:hypothetical protein Q0Z83_046020 [Actinoplanes sichuanensis]|uniref:Uncharacterized protein n=1 Tax=Actinoplanes sichuanensis TaxID=512349 RepID=A0ABW4AB61_9ACTN|nr:hypothetical protein [Actinoplanes sichuanensis]BEL06411.1 hypothetical protein Q0Z83_046020 [Actinoplanes sichuanensis]
MARRSILVVGPRDLPADGLVSVWIDSGSGPGYTRQVRATDLSLSSKHDDGRDDDAIYALTLAECDG